MNMNVEMKPEMTVLMYQVQTTLAEITEHMHVAQQMYAEVVKNSMMVCGCNYWIYRGCEGNMNQPFELQIVLPVLPTGPVESAFEVTKLPAFKCVTRLHEGAWSELGNTYAPLMADMAKEGFTPGKCTREMYLHCDFQDQRNCVTELQIEVL